MTTVAPLIRAHVVEAVRNHLGAFGLRDMGVALDTSIRERSTFLQACAAEAAAVLRGDQDAATRLWLLLKDPIEPEPVLELAPGTPLWAPDAAEQAPKLIDGDALLHLVAGVVRAAQQPGESDLMLHNLGAALQPIFVLEGAASAAERATLGDGQAITAIAARFRTSHQRAVHAGPLDVSSPVSLRPFRRRVPEDWAEVIRPEFDRASWVLDAAIERPDLWELPWRCVASVRKVVSQTDRFGVPYTLESILNGSSCVGSVVTLRGRNFGPTGRVNFSYPRAADPAFELGATADALFEGVEPISWTDTEILVVVPPWATTGPIRLSAFIRHVDLCTTIDVYRLGNSIPFLGGLGAVTGVSVAGRPIALNGSDVLNFVPGETVTVGYEATSSPSARVRIELVGNDTSVLWSSGDLPGGRGDVVMSVPRDQLQVPRQISLVLIATSFCGATMPRRVPATLTVPPRLTIEYIEVTQGVQGSREEVMAGQGMPLVADKDTAVRVHMRCDRGGWYDDRLDRITGSLAVDGRVLAPTNARQVVPDTKFAGIKGYSDPALTNDTLNFTIPAGWVGPGPHTLVVRLVCEDLSGFVRVSATTTWTWTARRPLPVRVLYMALYATDSQMLRYARRVLDYLPTPLSDIGIAAPGWYRHAYDLSVIDGWEDLLDDLEDAWDDFDEAGGVRWLGIVPAADRRGGATLGISGTPSIAVLASEDRPDSGAHELGHSIGLNHVNLTNGRLTPDGPFDEVDSGGRLRRPPFDVRDSKVVPLPAGDLMSYFTPVRPGITTWMRLFNNF